MRIVAIQVNKKLISKEKEIFYKRYRMKNKITQIPSTKCQYNSKASNGKIFLLVILTYFCLVCQEIINIINVPKVTCKP